LEFAFVACSPFQVPAIRSKADLKTDICSGVIGKRAKLAHPAAIEHRGGKFLRYPLIFAAFSAAA